MNEQGINSGEISNSKFNLTKNERFFYSLTHIANAMLSGIFSLTYVNFFWDDLALQQILFTLGQIIYAIVNSINDFYLGRISDNTNAKRWGSRRLIYIKWGGVLWAVIFFVMWIPWSYDNQIIIFIHYLVSICAFDMMLTLVWLVWLAVLPELTENTKERNKIQLNNQFMAIIGYFPVLLAFLIYESGLIIFQTFAGICALICGSIYFLVGSKLRERPELYVEQKKIPLGKALKEVFKSKSFTSYSLFRSFHAVNYTISSSFLFAYFYVLGVDLFTASISFYLIFTLVAVIGYIIYKKLSENNDMRTIVIRGRTIQMVGMIIGFFIVLQPGTSIFIWIFLAFDAVLGGYMLFDYPFLFLITDEDEVINGNRREGLILGTSSVFLKIAESVGPVLGTTVLLLFGFIRDAPFQSAEALVGIKVLMFIIPTTMNLLGLIFMFIFPLHDKRLDEMRSKLLKLHEVKSEKFKSK